MSWRKEPEYADSGLPQVDYRRIELASELLGKLVKDPFADEKDVELVKSWLRGEQAGDKTVRLESKDRLRELCEAFSLIGVKRGDELAEATREVFEGKYKDGRTS